MMRAGVATYMGTKSATPDVMLDDRNDHKLPRKAEHPDAIKGTCRETCLATKGIDQPISLPM